MQQTRQYHRCGIDPSGNLIAFGGYVQSPSWVTLATIEYYNTFTGFWNVVPAVPSDAVLGFGFVLDSAGLFYILGGTNNSITNVDHIQYFNTNTGLFGKLDVTLAIPHSNMGKNERIHP